MSNRENKMLTGTLAKPGRGEGRLSKATKPADVGSVALTGRDAGDTTRKPHRAGHRDLDGKGAFARRDVSQHEEWLLDEALKETFPASDPISPARPTKSHAQTDSEQ
jgi:hypothetical protein